MARPQGNGEPFDLVGDRDLGVLCIHGFTGTPYELRFVGEQLAAHGYHTLGLRLPGHGTTIAELDATIWQDWTEAVERAFDVLRARCTRVAVVGQSLGGLLALHLAATRREVAAVIALATPLWFDGLAARAARWTADDGPLHWLRSIPKLGGPDVRDRRAARDNPCYRRVPMRAFAQLTDFMRVVDAELPAITQPVLVVHARHDHTAPVACAARIAGRTRARRVRLLDRSYHLIAIDVERDIVVAEITTFLSSLEPPCAT